MKLEARRRIAVAVGLAAFIAAGLAVAPLAVQVPGFQQACVKQCALQHEEGRLVYKGPLMSNVRPHDLTSVALLP